MTHAAIIAALYVVLTLIARAFGLDSGAVQFRLSEALTILPFFTAAAIPGLFVGCFLANILCGCFFWDVVFGSLATLLGAVLTWLLHRYARSLIEKRASLPDSMFSRLLRQHKWLAPVPPILCNMLIIPFVLRYVYGLEESLYFFAGTVGLGEVVTCGILGMALLHALLPKKEIFQLEDK